MSNELKIDITRLEDVLDVCGADRFRWPAPERAALELFIDGNASAQRLVHEAEALERVMSASPPLVASDDLKARIVAAVSRDSEHPARVVPISAAKTSAEQGHGTRLRMYWPAGALAASFAFGLYLGFAGLGEQTFDGAVQVSGLVAENSDAESASWLDFSSGSSTEDVL